MTLVKSEIGTATLLGMLSNYVESENSVQVMEDDVVLFRLVESRYSVSDSNGKCLLHLWSEERSVVRRVLDAELKHRSLLLTVQRFGKTQPSTLEFVPASDSRSGSARKAA